VEERKCGRGIEETSVKVPPGRGHAVNLHKSCVSFVALQGKGLSNAQCKAHQEVPTLASSRGSEGVDDLPVDNAPNSSI
jgi:hypothetical protein